MNEIFQKPANVQKLVAEIKEFIEEKREPDEIVNAMVTAISKNENTITLELEEDFNFYPGALVTVNKIGGTVQDKYSNIIKVATKEKVKFEEGNTVKIELRITSWIKTIKKYCNSFWAMDNHITMIKILFFNLKL
jgi:predicted DNA-binding antitoxin AbrB/MazE fold protein